ncbi:chaperone modulator CbpM [Rivularia sp. UHCC 0363]|uniref:chaperone modulator CbpM n=1 Tax=Rivularia sp. UHCC 0363 TaxID=3110244 RepID=UPI002B21B43E|nr:chaperone modulator CbpM [Rivularia sp. UHCC 0363]MEA5597255.1 chaperone modulator CbpM [Rivularia sp. UHCC 0363]
MNQISRFVVSVDGEDLISFEQAATITQTSVTVIERFSSLGLIEPEGVMLRPQDVTRIMQIIRLRQDLGLNLIGASMVLEMAQEIAQLKSQVEALRKNSEQ